jgi:CRP-like cAMP-binding protein
VDLAALALDDWHARDHSPTARRHNGEPFGRLDLAVRAGCGTAMGVQRSRPSAQAASALRDAMQAYAPIEDETLSLLLDCARVVEVDKDGFYCRQGDRVSEFGFVLAGLLRYFVRDVDGNDYNKIFFDEGTFPGPIAALLRGEPADVSIQALEPSRVLSFDFAGYRAVLAERRDLMWFQIRYLERNWLLKKEPREFSLVQEEAAVRYRRFRDESPRLAARLPLFHVASHLGVTPTQLSRIRRAERDA